MEDGFGCDRFQTRVSAKVGFGDRFSNKADKLMIEMVLGAIVLFLVEAIDAEAKINCGNRQ